MVRTRFAPSPTGFLHVGGLRTALFSYLFAKKHGGTFILRIEDTDQGRFVEGSVKDIVESLAWAGISPDEGVQIAADGTLIDRGQLGPYVQSKRLPLYQKYINQLLEIDKAYPCFCDRERLEQLRQTQEANKQATGYDGKCRNLTSTEIEVQKSAGTPFVIRLKVPREGVTTFHDLIRGDIEFQNVLIDDQVLIKSDGFPTYHFAVVVDDHLMEITHVVRGDEWLSSTPKHIILYDFFGWTPPQFAHLSLLVNEQKQKLSKRHGDVSVGDFRKAGYLAEALVNFVAFLGWNPGDEREIFSVEQLIQDFDFSKVTKAPAVFNREKLAWYNKQYLTSLPLADVAIRAKSFFSREQNLDTDKWNQTVDLERARVTTLAEFPEALQFIFVPTLDYPADLLVWKKSTAEATKVLLERLVSVLSACESTWNKEHIENSIRAWIEQESLGAGDVLWPLRVALSGLKNSPPPFDIAAVLGMEKTLERVRMAIEKLSI